MAARTVVRLPCVGSASVTGGADVDRVRLSLRQYPTKCRMRYAWKVATGAVLLFGRSVAVWCCAVPFSDMPLLCLFAPAGSRQPRLKGIADSYMLKYVYTKMQTFILLSDPRRRLLLALALAAGPLHAQAPAAPLGLDGALAEAGRHAYAIRIAEAATSEARATARLPLRGILPSARLEAGVIRTTDPIGAFGAALRQRRITPAAFDPDRLNTPAPISNVQRGIVVEVPLFNADAYTGRRAALAAASATSASGEWTARSVRLQVVRAWYGAVLAAEKVRTLRVAQEAAQAGARQVDAMVRQGLVTKADALQAGVRVLDVQSQLLAAQDDALSARQQLATLLGRTLDDLPAVPAALPEDAGVLQLAARDTASVTAAGAMLRADLRAATDGMAAADADYRRAASTLLPRVNSFARYDWYGQQALAGGEGNWTVGLMASWSLFGGGSELTEMARTSARAAGARAGRDAATAQARVEADVSRRAVTLALQRRSLATQADQQSREVHRLVMRRYEGGLATVAELLAADASATGAALTRSAARHALLDAIATHRHVIGGDAGDLATLDPGR